MPKKQSKKKLSKKADDTIDSEMSSEESDLDIDQDDQDQEEQDQEEEFEDTELNDSDIEEEEEEEYEDKEEGDEISVNSIKEGDKEENCFFSYDKENDMDLFDDDEEYDNETQTDEFLTEDNRISINRMSLYEFVRVIGTRTKQLSMGAKPMIKNHQGLSSKEIAIQELKNNTLPLIIKRPLPDNRFEIWKINELEKSHLF
jgi:DNA-directed RNA polymerase subunit K/omega